MLLPGSDRLPRIFNFTVVVSFVRCTCTSFTPPAPQLGVIVLMFEKMQINTVVNIGFFLVILLFAILAIMSQKQISKIETDSTRVTSLRAPTAKASASVNIALNKSLAALRGWVLLGEDRFLKGRQEAWQSIHTEKAKLLVLSKDWTNPRNVERLSEAVKLLDQLEIEQVNIELIAHKLENVRSSEILLNDAIPLASSVADRITTMIDFAKSQNASPDRLALLAAMADFRGSFALSLADIRAFLLAGDARFKGSFELHWLRNEKSYQNLNTLTSHMAPFEIGVLHEIKLLREEFSHLPKQMINARQSDNWNQANYLLKTTAVVTANELVYILQKMVSNQNILLKEDAELIIKEAKNLKTFQFSFLCFSLLLTIYLSVVINKKYRAFRDDQSVRDSLVDQNVLIAIFDKEGNTISISNALCRCLGGVKRDFLGKNSNYFIPREDNAQLLDNISKSLLTGKEWQGEFKRYSPSGEVIWLSSAIFPVKNEGEGDSKGSFHNILENITNRKLLEEVSVTDGLTSLYNRRKFDEVIEHEIELARRRKTHLTLAVIDIDYFKKYNDNYGHPEGDTALVRTAATIRSFFSRPDDYVFRLGGEEFGIIFNSLNEEDTMNILERVRMSIEQLEIEHNQNSVSDYITISIGAKVCEADKLFDKDAFYSEADRLLYIAKQKRNTVVVD